MGYWIGVIVLIAAVILMAVSADQAGYTYAMALDTQAMYGPEMSARWFSMTYLYSASCLVGALLTAGTVLFGIVTINQKED